MKFDETLKTKILFEISQINKLLSDSKPLIDLCKLKVPDFVELSAVALVLHSFYNGIENILKLITKFYDKKLPEANKWHIELLESAFVSNENRKQIFKLEEKELLEEYLKFRHFVRHSYGFQLEWDRMENLVSRVNNFWEIVKDNLTEFMNTTAQ